MLIPLHRDVAAGLNGTVLVVLARLIHNDVAHHGGLCQSTDDILRSRSVTSTFLDYAVKRLDIQDLFQAEGTQGSTTVIIDLVSTCIYTGNQHLLEPISATLAESSVEAIKLPVYLQLDDLLQTLPEALFPASSLRLFFYNAIPLHLESLRPDVAKRFYFAGDHARRSFPTLPVPLTSGCKEIDQILRPIVRTGDTLMLEDMYVIRLRFKRETSDMITSVRILPTILQWAAHADVCHNIVKYLRDAESRRHFSPQRLPSLSSILESLMNEVLSVQGRKGLGWSSGLPGSILLCDEMALPQCVDAFLDSLQREAPWEPEKTKAICDLLPRLEGTLKRESRRSCFKVALLARIPQLGPRPHGATEPPDITTMRCRASQCLHCPRVRGFFHIDNGTETLSLYSIGPAGYKHMCHQLTTHLDPEPTLAEWRPTKYSKHSITVRELQTDTS